MHTRSAHTGVSLLHHTHTSNASMPRTHAPTHQPTNPRADIRTDPRYAQDASFASSRVALLVGAASHELLHGSAATAAAISTAAMPLAASAGAIARYNAAARYIEAARVTAASANDAGASALVAAAAAAADMFRANIATAGGPAAAVGASLGGVGASASAAAADERARLRASAAANLAASEAAFGKAQHATAQHHAASGASTSFNVASGVNIPGLLVAAALAFERKDYARARAAYAAIIEAQPAPVEGSSPFAAAVRVGLGLCLYRLGHLAAAKMAFRRALALDAGNIHALACYAYMEACHGASSGAAHQREGDGQREKGRAMEALKRAVGAATSADVAGAAAAHLPGLSGAAPALAGSDAAAVPAAALLELSHYIFGHWAPAPSLTVTVTRGSNKLVLSEPSHAALARFRPNETLKIGVVINGVLLMVPLRLQHRDHAVMLPASALRFATTEHLPRTAYAANEHVAVLQCRSVWGRASATGLPVYAIDVERAQKFARSALTTLKPSGVLPATPAATAAAADAYYALGRALHAAGAYIDAGIQYREALKLNAGHLPAEFGAAQIAAQQGRVDDAVKHLQRVLAAKPDDASACKLLAALHLRRAEFGAATDAARRACDMAPWDAAAAALYASLLQREDGKAAAEKAIRVCEESAKRLLTAGVSVPAALWCNLGSLHARIGGYYPSSTPTERAHAFSTARDMYHRGLRQVAEEAAPGTPAEVLAAVAAGNSAGNAAAAAARAEALHTGTGVTIAYNLARLDEMAGHGDAAAEAYEGLLQRHPGYFDAALRLAAIAAAAGRETNAVATLEDVIRKATSAASAANPHAVGAAAGAYVMLGQLHEAAGRAAAAKDSYAAAVRLPGQAGDPYAALSLANITFSQVSAATHR